MASVRLAVERARSIGALPIGAAVSLREVHQRLRPSTRGSTRAMVSDVFGTGAQRPWAVLLCRFKGLENDPAIETFYREIFAAGTGGLVEYWRDVSLGAIDISGSAILGWIELDLAREDAGGTGRQARKRLLDHAVRAAKRDGVSLDRFYSTVVVLTHRWTRDDIPAGEPTWQDGDPMAPYYKYWIEGSAYGRAVVQTPPFSGNVLAHEMGHGFDMHHDVGADLETHYADPCCIMSQQNAFLHPTWDAFGPALCLAHLYQRGWMFSHRVHYERDWWTKREGVTSPLAPINDPGARANLGLRLPARHDGAEKDYFVEYVRPTGWNRGLPEPIVIIRRIDTVEDLGQAPVYLHQVTIPKGDGFHQWIDGDTGVDFRVYRSGDDDRAVTMHVRRAT